MAWSTKTAYGTLVSCSPLTHALRYARILKRKQHRACGIPCRAFQQIHRACLRDALDSKTSLTFICNSHACRYLNRDDASYQQTPAVTYRSGAERQTGERHSAAIMCLSIGTPSFIAVYLSCFLFIFVLLLSAVYLMMTLRYAYECSLPARPATIYAAAVVYPLR